MNNILIVDDDQALRKVLREKLELEGYGVIESVNGEEGLKTALEKHPDLILLDMMMPILDGMSMLDSLRKSGDWGKKVRVIVLTNVSGDSNEVIHDVTNLEPSYYLIKSDWKLEDLMSKIEEVLGYDEKNLDH